MIFANCPLAQWQLRFCEFVSRQQQSIPTIRLPIGIKMEVAHLPRSSFIDQTNFSSHAGVDSISGPELQLTEILPVVMSSQDTPVVSNSSAGSIQ